MVTEEENVIFNCNLLILLYVSIQRVYQSVPPMCIIIKRIIKTFNLYAHLELVQMHLAE